MKGGQERKKCEAERQRISSRIEKYEKPESFYYKTHTNADHDICIVLNCCISFIYIYQGTDAAAFQGALISCLIITFWGYWRNNMNKKKIFFQ